MAAKSTDSQREAMKYETGLTLRFASFQTFPKSVSQTAFQFASAGFYYVGKNDEVECFDCGLKLKDWGPSDDPFEVHKRYSADCPYINNNAVENVQLASEGASGDPSQATATDLSCLSTSNDLKETVSTSMAQKDVSQEARRQQKSTRTDQRDKKSVSARPGRIDTEASENCRVEQTRTSPLYSAVVSGSGANSQRQRTEDGKHQVNLRSIPSVQNCSYNQRQNDETREVNLRDMSHVANSSGNDPLSLNSQRAHFNDDQRAQRLDNQIDAHDNQRVNGHGNPATEIHDNPSADNQISAVPSYQIELLQVLPLSINGTKNQEHSMYLQGGSQGVCQQNENVPTNNTVTIQKIFLTGFKYPVRRKTVRRVMKTDLVRAVVKWCNIPESDMAVVVRKRLEQLNEPFPNFESLMEAVYEYQEDLCRAEKIRLTRRAEEIRLARQQHIANLLPSREELMEERMCKICRERDTTVAFLKCGHLFCGQCAIWVIQVGRNRCPICRQIIVRLLAIERVSS